MQIAQTLSGFSPSEVDLLRRAMGKKKVRVRKAKSKIHRRRFKNGISKSVAAEFF